MQNTANASATRRRRPRLSPGTCRQSIAKTMNGFNGVIPACAGQRPAQLMHVAPQGIAGFLHIPPHFRFKLLTAENPAGLAHHDSEQPDALWRELDTCASKADGQRF